MLDFNKELERFKPLQDIESTQSIDLTQGELASEELEDIIDVLKCFQKDIKKEKHNMRKEE